MKLELSQRVEQQLILAPQMILSMDILLLSSADLESRIEQEFMENPALEIREKLADSVNDPLEESRKKEEVFAKIESFESQEWSNRDFVRRSRSSSAGDEKLDALQNTEGRAQTLHECLIVQLSELVVPAPILSMAEYVIWNLDDRGYLVDSIEHLEEGLAQEERRYLYEALDLVRTLDPPGVGAHDLGECLLLQLERDPQEYPLETRILTDHLNDLRENRIPKIARRLGVSIDEVKNALELISMLNPNPGSGFAATRVSQVRPDVVVEQIEDRFEVRVENSRVPQLRISDSCRRLLQEANGDPGVLEFVRRKIESAQWLIQAVKQRQRTLYDIAVAIVDYQHDFMTRGLEYLRPMKMQTIADIVGVHISTVSRAIKGKYMDTPMGILAMRYFFSGGIARDDGEMESRRNIYREIAEIIENEDKSRPYSDSEIARILRGRGLQIARRTVTKYRERERIPSSRLRKVY